MACVQLKICLCNIRSVLFFVSIFGFAQKKHMCKQILFFPFFLLINTPHLPINENARWKERNKNKIKINISFFKTHQNYQTIRLCMQHKIKYIQLMCLLLRVARMVKCLFGGFFSFFFCLFPECFCLMFMLLKLQK